MNGNSPGVADALRRFGDALVRTHRARTVLARLRDCGTAALGGHVWRCTTCDHQRIAYNSCRDRHCPRCLGNRSRQWLDQRLAELLPVPHFHVVFTLPEELRPIALGNPRALYTLLFDVAASTLATIGRDPKHLGAKLGFFGILHTWGQSLDYHPHVHFVVPGGGLALDGEAWVPSRARFLVSARVLAALYRRRLLEGLEALRIDGSIDLPLDLREPNRWKRLLRRLRRKKWVVHLKEPFATPARVLEYLARYTHRVAIADGRIRSIDDDGVRFDYKCYRTGRRGVMRLAGQEFVRRFALHVLPERFVRIRYYGFLAHRGRHAHLELCRRLIEGGDHAVVETDPAANPSTSSDAGEASEPSAPCCPRCQGRMVRLYEVARRATFPRKRSVGRAPPTPA